MPKPAITLEVLPAGYGDCLLVECPVGRRTWRLLVDTGPDETFPLLKARLARIRPDARGRRHIDLAIVSHIDHDHIGGAGLLFADRELGLSFGDVWFNAPPRPRARGVAEGEGLAALLGAPGATLPWNRAFEGAAVVTGSEGVRSVPTARGAPRLTLLSPDAAALAALFKVWDRELAKLRARLSDSPSPVAPLSRDVSAPDLQALAARKDRGRPGGAEPLEHRDPARAPRRLAAARRRCRAAGAGPGAQGPGHAARAAHTAACRCAQAVPPRQPRQCHPGAVRPAAGRPLCREQQRRDLRPPGRGGHGAGDHGAAGPDPGSGSTTTTLAAAAGPTRRCRRSTASTSSCRRLQTRA